MVNRTAFVTLLFPFISSILSQDITSEGSLTQPNSGVEIASEGAVRGSPGATILSTGNVAATWASVDPTPTTWASVDGSLSSWAVLPSLTGSALANWYSSQGWASDTLTTETVVEEGGQIQTIVGPLGTFTPLSDSPTAGLSSAEKLGLGLGVGLGGLVISVIVAILLLRVRNRNKFHKRTSRLRTMSERQNSV